MIKEARNGVTRVNGSVLGALSAIKIVTLGLHVEADTSWLLENA